MTSTIKPELLTFDGLGIEPNLLDIIRHLNFTIPTPIQLKSIPVIGEGKDMVGIAQTGTGKTLAFGIPILQRLSKYKGRCLILVPTRELASQVNDHLKIIAQKLNLKTVVLIGGESKHPQIRSLQGRPELIIATPGRLIDHLESKNLNLNEVKCLVLDEADLMFDMGFAPQLNKILKLSPKEKQTVLFSATMPPSIMEIATKHMTLPVRIEVAPAGTPAANVIQEVIILHKEDRTVQLQKILSQYKGSVLIFVRTKSSVKNICRNISNMNHTVAEIHSNRTLVQRTKALRGFKEGQYRILVATDIAARGIDVKGIELVLNYDLPDNIEDYIHRIGRTGRAGKMGQAISFATPSQIMAIRKIEKMIKKEIPLTKLAEFRAEDRKPDQSHRHSGSNKFRDHKKSHQPTHKYQDKKWHQQDKPATGYQGDYERFKKSKERPSENGQHHSFNRFDRYKKSQTSDHPSRKPAGGFSSNKYNRPYQKSQTSGYQSTTPASDFNNTTSNKTGGFGQEKSSRPYHKNRASDYQSKTPSSNFNNRTNNKSGGFGQESGNRPFQKRSHNKFKGKRNFPKKRY